MHLLVASYLDYKPPGEMSPENENALAGLLTDMPVNTSAPKLDDSAWQKFIADKDTPHVRQ